MTTTRKETKVIKFTVCALHNSPYIHIRSLAKSLWFLLGLKAVSKNFMILACVTVILTQCSKQCDILTHGRTNTSAIDKTEHLHIASCW